MRLLLPAAVLCSAVLLAACTNGSDTEIKIQDPILGVAPSSIDFGEVVVGTYSQLTVTVENSGLGPLDIESISIPGSTSTEFELVDAPTDSLGALDTSPLTVKYTPSAEGEDHGEVDIVTNDPTNPTLIVPLTATGVEPCIDIDPETLNFGRVETGQAEAQTFTIRACGTGDLVLEGFQWPGSEAVAYSYTLPGDWETAPFTVPNATAGTVTVTFTPPSEDVYEGELQILTNDPSQPVAVVRLQGNTDDPPENACPEVEIGDPNYGASYLDNELVTLRGHIVDDDPPSTSLCAFYANDTTTLATGNPDDSGNIEATTLLPAGDIEISLRCFDPHACVGEDTVSVTVYPAEDPVKYTISGGDSIFDYINVDDDLRVTVNGTTIVYNDASEHPSSIPPFEFEALRGDVITVRLIDQNATECSLDPLVLWFGTSAHQALNPQQCFSSDPANPCYDGTYDGPWPQTAFEEDYTISIP